MTDAGGVVDEVGGEGFDAFFRAAYPPLVRALGPAHGPEAAADAVQEAFIRAALCWRRVGRYDDPAAWVRRVAVNLLIDGHRRGRRGERALTLLAAGSSDEVPAPGADGVGGGGAGPGGGLGVGDPDLRAALAGLAERQRVAVCLHYLLDLSVAEVAEALGVAPGTVKSQLHDARRALARTLEVHDG